MDFSGETLARHYQDMEERAGLGRSRYCSRDHTYYRRDQARSDRGLTNTERRFMLNAERGDCASVVKILEEQQAEELSESLDINCTDPLVGCSCVVVLLVYNVMIQLWWNNKLIRTFS